MRETICPHQETMLETRLNIHVSRCSKRESENYLGPVHKEMCQACQHREPVVVDAAQEAEMADYLFPETISGGRPPELIDELVECHCKSCKHYSPGTGVCFLSPVAQSFPIRDLMENETIHCAKGAW